MNKYNVITGFFLREIPIHLINIITGILPNHFITNRIRGFFIGLFLGKCGKRLQIGKGVIINNPGSLYIGDDCYISHYCYIQAKGIVTLEDDVVIGPMSVVASSKHIIKEGKVTNKGISNHIFIGEGTWCGSHVVISSGVSIEKSVIVGAGAVVVKDIEKNNMVVGVPAKPIGNNSVK